MIIGRKEEQRKLLEAFRSEYSEFVAVYGRRRVGKTFLIRECFNYHFSFYHTGLSNKPTREQLASFRDSLQKHGKKDYPLPNNWYEAFNMLSAQLEALPDGKKVVFIDEMPWMDAPRSSFVSALEYFWNNWASARKDILLIICGSATSWIINKVIKNHGGLHGRVTCRIHLQPFTLNECEQYALSRHLRLNRRQIMEGYMILGGIPFYWSMLERGRSLVQNVDTLFFSGDGALSHEFDDLYASLFRRPEKYIQVVNILGTKRIGLTREDIVHDGGLDDNGMLSSVLEDLEYCGFIRKYTAIGKKTKGAIYQLIDNYTLFYFRFVKGGKVNDEHYWSKIDGSPTYNTWCGLAFECVCLQHVRQIKTSLGINGVITNVCSWRSAKSGNGKGTQIDLLIDRNDKVINLCEMKFSKTPFSITSAYLLNLENKRNSFVTETHTTKAVHITMIASDGMAENANSDEVQNVVTGDDLFCD